MQTSHHTVTHPITLLRQDQAHRLNLKHTHVLSQLASNIITVQHSVNYLVADLLPAIKAVNIRHNPYVMETWDPGPMPCLSGQLGFKQNVCLA